MNSKNPSDSSDYDPFKVLENNQADWPEHLDVLGDAISRFNPNKPDPLVALLQSQDEIVTRRALAMFGDLGSKAIGVLDSALPLVGHKSVYARSHILDGILCYPERLTALQIKKILPLAADAEDIIRGKMVTILATVKLGILAAAISQMPAGPQKLAHESGLKFHVEALRSTQSIFDLSIAAPKIEATYMLASLNRRARDSADTKVPDYAGDDYVHVELIAQMKRILRK